MCNNCGCNENIFDYEGENDPDFDESKADRNKDGKISDWERSVGNAVAKSMREQKENKSAEDDDEEYFEYHVYVVDNASFGDMYIVDNARDFETKEEAIKAAHEVSKDERGKGKTVYVVAEDRENDYEEVFYEINEEGDVMMAEEFGADNCEGKKLKDSGYCNLNFGWSSSGLSRSCQTCGNEEFMDDYWDSQRISMSEPEEGKILCSMTEFNGGRDENDLGYCSFDFNYGSDGAFSECDVCGTEVMATFDNSFYDDDDDDDDDEFESEFSKGDMLNLKKYIDYPISWINKHIAPSNERKARKFDQKERGQIPTKKEPEDFRQSIKTPLWFKAVQLGILASVVGIISFKDISNNSSDEEPEEPEEQKEE